MPVSPHISQALSCIISSLPSCQVLRFFLPERFMFVTCFGIRVSGILCPCPCELFVLYFVHYRMCYLHKFPDSFICYFFGTLSLIFFIKTVSDIKHHIKFLSISHIFFLANFLYWLSKNLVQIWSILYVEVPILFRVVFLGQIVYCKLIIISYRSLSLVPQFFNLTRFDLSSFECVCSN